MSLGAFPKNLMRSHTYYLPDKECQSKLTKETLSTYCWSRGSFPYATCSSYMDQIQTVPMTSCYCGGCECRNAAFSLFRTPAAGARACSASLSSIDASI